MRKATGWAERNQEHWRREEEKGDELRTEYWVGGNVCSRTGEDRTGQHNTERGVLATSGSARGSIQKMGNNVEVKRPRTAAGE